MNTKIKMRLLSLLLCFVILIGLMPITALAAGEIHFANITITKPVGGANPDFNPVSAEPDKYSIEDAHSFSWSKMDGISYPTLGVEDTFETHARYELRVLFVAKAGYTFADDCVFTINGETTGCWGLDANEFRHIYLYAADPLNPTYTVGFDANGGIGTMDDVIGVFDKYKLPACGFTAPEGKYFGGWLVNSYLKEPGETITVLNDTTVTASWRDIPSEGNGYSVTYNGGEGSGGTMEGKTDFYGELTLPVCGFTAPSGKQFSCWRVGNNDWYPGDEIIISFNTEIYAVWEAIEYDVTVTGGTASVGAGTPITKATMGTTVTLTADAAPSGQMFDKWVVSGVVVADVKSATTTFTMPAGNVTAQATYKDISATGTPLTVVIVSGKDLEEYSLSEGCAIELLVACDQLILDEDSGNITNSQGKLLLRLIDDCLYLVDGLTEQDNINYVLTEQDKALMQAACGENISEINLIVYDAGSSQPTTYTVTFDSNGGTGTMTDITGMSGDYMLPMCEFTAPAGKQFKCWAKDSVNGTQYNAGYGCTVDADVTFYAIWKDIPVTYYTVTFDSNGGSAITAQTIEEGQKATKPADPTKDGHDFKGWTLNGSAYNFNSAVNGNITLVASWEQQQVVPTTYTVSFAANGGSGTMADVTGISGEYTLPANGFTAPEGKQFKAWSVNGNEKAVGDKITIIANTSVTAVWEDIPAGHTCDIKPVEKVKPSCTESGKEAYYKCEGCGKFYEDALGAKEITDLAAWGNLQKLGHTESGWKSDAYNHWKECTVEDCGLVIENSKAKHKDDNNDGECDLCEYNVGVDNNIGKKPSSNLESPKTGDNGRLWLWLAILFISSAVVFRIVVYNRKKNIVK